MLDTKFNFRNLFVLDLANNHQGDIDHALKIIKSVGKVVNNHNVRSVFKFQFRQLETFIHPDHKTLSDNKHIPRFLSTEMKSYEFEILLNSNLDLNKIYFMHCVSSYPLEEVNVNFPKLIKIKQLHNKIGYSGHLKGISDAIAAISLGAKIVEKHFTIDNDLPGRDNQFAVLPEDMKKICDYRDSFYNMSMDKGLDIQECEKDINTNYRGRWSKI